MLAKIFSATTRGVDAVRITVEVNISTRGLPGFQIVGLPSKAVDESRVRVKAALENAGYKISDKKITVNLAPANIRKDGSLFDLPIAVGILVAQGVLNFDVQHCLIVGELSLNGDINPVSGVLPILASEQASENNQKITKAYIPFGNVHEAKLSCEIHVYAARSLQELIRHIKDGVHIKKIDENFGKKIVVKGLHSSSDFKFIKGQEHAKRALEIAAAGGHNVHMHGPPGTGKTMLARGITTILPDLDDDELLEVAKIYSITRAGQSHKAAESFQRPFRSPHHTITRIGLVGGGVAVQPGEISFAHRGVLFLDEFPEYPRHIIESLRQPLEDGFVGITRAQESTVFPCRFTLVVASNPCPCGYLGQETKQCTCTGAEIARYAKKMSGPIVDRIDIHVHVSNIKNETLASHLLSEPSTNIRARVNKARVIQKERFLNHDIHINSEMSPQHIREACNMAPQSMNLLKQASESLSLSPRSFFKVIKVAQTIADLEASQKIKKKHVAEALQYRSDKY